MNFFKRVRGNYTLSPLNYTIFYAYPYKNYDNAYFIPLNYYLRNTCLPKLLLM